MDIADQAQIMEQENLNHALAHHKNQSQHSHTHCIDCEVEIPEQRRKHGGITRCIDCQSELEAKNKHIARKY